MSIGDIITIAIVVVLVAWFLQILTSSDKPKERTKPGAAVMKGGCLVPISDGESWYPLERNKNAETK